MTGGQQVAVGAAAALLLGVAAGIAITYRRHPREPASLIGTVLRKDTDPRRQMPIENAEITATNGLATVSGKSDSSGFFRLTLPPGIKRGQAVALTFRHPGYQHLQVSEPASERIYIARLLPVSSGAGPKPNNPPVAITDVRLRYSLKSTTTTNVGSFAKTFEVGNTGGLPCRNHPPCSPDGKWKAEIGSASFDTEAGNEFRNIRASCIAGPCPFTRIESETSKNGDRTIKVSALDWSDTATFLVEAEVITTFSTDVIRHSYPAIFGGGMNFTLPPAAEGPTIEAELNGSPIVFPLGPDLILSWATCDLKVDADQSRLYRCQLKPGYEFR
ncbi:MAG: carboxypeptidase-like regulatory domain-containing protein [Bryobacteraceae bacterium]